jgi:uncharacterized membrane protein
LPLIRRRVSEISRSAFARANEVSAELKHPGFDEAALSRFAELVADRAQRCASTV